jgi:hypothetical protein
MFISQYYFFCIVSKTKVEMCIFQIFKQVHLPNYQLQLILNSINNKSNIRKIKKSILLPTQINKLSELTMFKPQKNKV